MSLRSLKSLSITITIYGLITILSLSVCEDDPVSSNDEVDDPTAVFPLEVIDHVYLTEVDEGTYRALFHPAVFTVKAEITGKTNDLNNDQVISIVSEWLEAMDPGQYDNWEVKNRNPQYL